MWKIVVLLTLVSAFAILPMAPASADGEQKSESGPDGGTTLVDEYVAMILEDNGYIVSGDIICPPSPQSISALADFNWGRNFDRTEAAIWLEDQVTGMGLAGGRLCVYDNDAYVGTANLPGAGVHYYNSGGFDRIQVWVDPVGATIGFGKADA